MNPPLLRPRSVAKILDVSEMTVRNLAAVGKLRGVYFSTRPGRQTLRFREEDVSAFIEENLRGRKG